jgi:hypothetical protein
VFANGAVEEGQWVENKLTGQCKVTYPDGRVLEGEFEDGKGVRGKCRLLRPTKLEKKQP